MAIVTIEDTGHTLTGDAEISAFLQTHNVDFERWSMAPAIVDLASQPTLDDTQKAQVIEGFRQKLDQLAESHGYIQADMVVLNPDTPGLDVALAKFDKEHYHTDDEVRFIVDGSGVFGFVGKNEQRFLVEVHAGEFISVPANMWHWFYLCDDKRIKALRLFQDMTGWVPHYRKPAEVSG